MLPHQIRREYKGEFKNGKFHNGFLSFLDNSYYIGDFNSSNRFSGMGRLTYTEGIFYQGDWANGVKYGSGEEKYLNGSRYMGNFLRNKKHGYGRMQYIQV